MDKDKIEVFLQGEGIRSIELISLPKQATIRNIIEAASAKGLIRPDGQWAVFVEDSDQELDLNTHLDAAGIKHRGRVHVHSCKKVHITVNFKEKTEKRDFPPSTTIHRIKKWAVSEKVFNLSEIDASEHLLQICGSSERPDEDTHLGTLVQCPECKICFDLVAKVRVEG